MRDEQKQTPRDVCGEATGDKERKEVRKAIATRRFEKCKQYKTVAEE